METEIHGTFKIIISLKIHQQLNYAKNIVCGRVGNYFYEEV